MIKKCHADLDVNWMKNEAATAVSIKHNYIQTIMVYYL